MTRALFTTWGRNILPAPKRSPTSFMPSISGPSITAQRPAELGERLEASADHVLVMPCTSACRSRSLDRPSRQASSRARCPWRHGASASAKLDEPLGRVGSAVEEHVLDVLAQVRGIVS
jgi:hypothetical protein